MTLGCAGDDGRESHTGQATSASTQGATTSESTSPGTTGTDVSTGTSAGTGTTTTTSPTDPTTGSTGLTTGSTDPTTDSTDPTTTGSTDPTDPTTTGEPACGDDVIPASVTALLDDVVGFAEEVTGGAGGCLYHVTNTNDSGPGSLRAGAEADEPLWIVFDIDGDITLDEEIRVTSNKTIDGRGAYIRIFDDGLHILDGTNNVIVENIIFKEDTNGSDSDDAIRLMDDAHTVWIDHVSFSSYPDGLLDITRRATNVTASWCKFSNHDKVMLIGASPDHDFDDVIRVTLHHNWFRETQQRHPRLRYGKVHSFNNYYESWGSYGAGASMESELYSERNIYEAGSNKDAVISVVGNDPSDGDVNSVDDWQLNGATVDENNPNSVFKPADEYSYSADTANDALRTAVVDNAGWRDIPLP